MTKRTGESVFLTFILIVGIAVFYGSWTVRIFVKEPITAKTYGCTISGLLILCTLIRMIRNLKLITAAKKTETIHIDHPVTLLVMMVASVFYCYGIANIGYYTCTFIFSIIMITVLSDQRTVKNIIIYTVGSLAFCAFLHVLFDLIQVYMPHTPLI